MHNSLSIAQKFPSGLAEIRPRIPGSGAAHASYLELGEGRTLVRFLRGTAGSAGGADQAGRGEAISP